MTERSRGYFFNSLDAWRDRLARDRKFLVARYGRMVKMGHPSAPDQHALICLNARMSELVHEARHAVGEEARASGQGAREEDGK